MNPEDYGELCSRLAALGEYAARVIEEGKGDSKELDDAIELYEQSYSDLQEFVETLAPINCAPPPAA